MSETFSRQPVEATITQRCVGIVVSASLSFFACVVHASSSFTPVEFAVSDTGSPSLTIPIQIPRGIGGMEPQLALNYSGGSGNGLVGIGWALSGLAAITRCPQTLATDGVRGSVNFDTNDRFCLDGQRLVLTGQNGVRPPPTAVTYGANNAEYRTERDSFTRVVSLGGTPSAPQSFRAWTKDGRILEFGSTAEGRVPTNFAPGGRAQTINRWLLDRMTDRHGNSVAIVYCQGRVDVNGLCTPSTFSGSTVPLFVRYTDRMSGTTVATPGQLAVQFRYENRPDLLPAFHAGSRTIQTQRLIAIETYVGWAGPSARGSLVRRYQISYEGTDGRATTHSRVAQVQEFDGAGASLRPIVMSMSRDIVYGQSVSHVPGVPAVAPPPPRPEDELCGRPINGAVAQCP